ncbi:MAG: antibiotic biosynthesis monooxygenase family protein [Spirosomataceae bacterium]
MLIRIVRMTFYSDKVTDFLEVFEQSKQKIRAMPGCHHLELLRDIDLPHVLMTYSFWENKEALDDYRNSDLFKSTWAKTKALFADKPLAYSVEKVEEV